MTDSAEMQKGTPAVRAQTARSTVRAVIFDWAGTTVDFGSFAPVVSIVETFEVQGVSIAPAEARGPMGLEKKEHIRRLLADDGIRERWRAATSHDPVQEDVEALFEDLEPRLLGAVRRHADLVPGTIQLLQELRARGIRIGSTTGYSRRVMDVLRPEAARRGFSPDVVVCPTDAPAGRPFPWMCFLNAMHLGVYPRWRLVKIGDTPADIQEGLNAGMWTIGVVCSGNALGLSPEELDSLLPGERSMRVEEAARHLRSAGAHYVVDGVWSCQAPLSRIEERLRRGELPSLEASSELA